MKSLITKENTKVAVALLAVTTLSLVLSTDCYASSTQSASGITEAINKMVAQGTEIVQNGIARVAGLIGLASTAGAMTVGKGSPSTLWMVGTGSTLLTFSTEILEALHSAII